jgi:hypothetical protein
MELEDELAFRLKEDVLMAPCALTLACKVLVLLEPPPMWGEALLEFRVVTRDVLHWFCSLLSLLTELKTETFHPFFPPHFYKHLQITNRYSYRNNDPT